MSLFDDDDYYHNDNNDNNNENNEIIDDKLIKLFEEEELLLGQFHRQNNKDFKLMCIYISKDNTIENIQEYIIVPKNKNCISKEELWEIIQSHRYPTSISPNPYYYNSILQYNLTLEPEQIREIYENKLDMTTETEKSLIVIDPLRNIEFKQTIQYLQSINSIILLYMEQRPRYQKKNHKHTQTRHHTHKIISQHHQTRIRHI